MLEDPQHSLFNADSIVDTVREPLLILSADLRVRRANSSFYRTFKVTPEETVDQHIYDLGNQQWAIPWLRNLLEDVLSKDTAFDDFEVDHVFPTIGRRFMLLNARRICRQDNQTEFILLAIEDTTERRQAEEARREIESRYTSLVKNIKDHAIFMMDLEGNITTWNAEAERIIGYAESEILGRNFSVIFPPDDRRGGLPEQELRLAREAGRAEDERWHVRKDGSRFWAFGIVTPMHDASGKLTGFSKILRDMTERKKTEELLCQAQKMEAVGRLAGGVAHELNNALHVILGYSTMLLGSVPKEQPMYEALCEIKNQGERAERLTGQLLAFGRRQMLAPVLLDLNDLVADVEKVLRHLLGESVHFVTRLDSNLQRVKVDPNQFKEVLVNLTFNARDAMPDRGEFTIQTANVDPKDKEVCTHPEAKAASYVMLAVSDTGRGMDEETRKRCLEPFFTTKEFGEGSGLGMSTVDGIVHQSGGFMTVSSELGKGTIFKVYLPAIEQADQSQQGTSSVSDMPSGTETVLVVQKDDALRSLTRTILQGQGYHVLEARHGEEALSFLESHGEPVHLVVTDTLLSEMSGRQLGERLWKVRPDTRVLFLSVGGEGAAMTGLPPAIHGVLAKPFGPGAFARKVREVLEKRA